MEVAVQAGGPALALLGFIVMSFVWGASEAAMTAELSIVYPEAAGWSPLIFVIYWRDQFTVSINLQDSPLGPTLRLGPFGLFSVLSSTTFLEFLMPQVFTSTPNYSKLFLFVTI